ncbi:MAG: cytochrome b N-terminal domain-containing protein, partial [bacterium]
MKNQQERKTDGLLSIVRDLLNEPMPKGVTWLQTLGSSLLALVVVQAITGILLALYYSPNADAAYQSVKFIEQQVIFGRLIRGLHYFAASGMVILVLLHMIRTFFYGAYKRPRQWTWIFGVMLLLIVLGFAFTGYLLPWDMKAFFATKVGINIAGVVPLLGKYIVKILQGGSDMGTITLSRFYTLHVVVLPLLLILVVGGHLYYIRLYGPTQPGLKEGEPVEYTNRFYPQQLLRDSLVVFIVVMVLVLFAANFGAPLEPKADPNDTSYVPRPDWYFYSLFQLLKIFEGKLEIIGAIIIPGAFFTFLILLPFLDKNPERRLSRRPLAVGLGSLVVFLTMLLTAWGAYEGEKAKKLMGAREEDLLLKKSVQEPAVGNPEQGKMLFTVLKCHECHKSSSEGLNIPPGLEFSGNKYQPRWLRTYLKNPYRIRWLSKNERPVIRMPDFNLSYQETLDISAYLMTFKIDEKFPEPDFDWSEVDSEMVKSGQELLVEYGCLGCHKIQDSGQNIGPALTQVGSKLREDYMFHLIKAPHKIIPDTPMKDFRLDNE